MGSPIEGTGKGKLETIDQKTGTSNRQLVESTEQILALNQAELDGIEGKIIEKQFYWPVTTTKTQYCNKYYVR